MVAKFSCISVDLKSTMAFSKGAATGLSLLHFFGFSALAQLSPTQQDLPAASALSERGVGDDFLFGPELESPFRNLLRWGNVSAQPHIASGISYDSRLRSATGEPVNTVSKTISPGVTVNLGRRWLFNYNLGAVFYSGEKLKDHLNHALSLAGGAVYGNWSFGLSQSYGWSEESTLETGRQTQQQSFGTSLSASRYFSGKWMLQMSLSQSIRSAEKLNGSRSWSTMEWMNYQIAPRVSIGGGIGGGYQDVDAGSNMTFQQLQARADARINEKLEMSINGGGEIRQVLDVGGDPLINPVYGASIRYRAFEHTTLSLAANRAVSASLLSNQITERSSVSIGVGQRLLGVLNLGLSGGYHTSTFLASATGVPVVREDDGFSFGARLGYGFIENGSVSVFFRAGQNTSSDSTFRSSSTGYGAAISYHF